jgi:hypothetical protein
MVIPGTGSSNSQEPPTPGVDLGNTPFRNGLMGPGGGGGGKFGETVMVPTKKRVKREYIGFNINQTLTYRSKVEAR